MLYAIYEDTDSVTARGRRSGRNGDGLRFGDCVFVTGGDEAALRSDASAARLGRVADHKELYLVRQKGRLFETSFPDVEVLHDGGRFLAVSATEAEYGAAREHASHCFEIEPLPESGTVFTRRPHAPSSTRTAAWLQALVDQVSSVEFMAHLEPLTEFPTRHSHSPNFAAAANLCVDVLTTLGYDAELQVVPLGSQLTFNVVADKPGAAADRNLVIAMAHLDSINIHGNIDSAAPGADDNGSGSAGVLEIARVFSGHAGVNDLRLILYGGEELGLFGSKHHVSVMNGDDKARLAAAVNMDMIGGLNLPTPAVLIEAGHQSVIDELSNAADQFTSLAVETSLNPFASDHVPFINAGLPAALTIEGADSNNDKIHTENDTLDQIDAELAEQIIRMNVGCIAQKLGNALA